MLYVYNAQTGKRRITATKQSQKDKIKHCTVYSHYNVSLTSQKTSLS
jgi:hypothetical protein